MNKKMGLIKFNIICCLTAVLFSTTSAQAWWSENIPGWSWDLFGDTHERLSKDTLNSLPEIEYPDLKKFYSVIWGATEGNFDDADAHGGDSSENDGDANEWWRLSKEQYEKLKFDKDRGAYWYIGQMIHLVEDMAVPAHALDILHYQNYRDLFDPDNFEHYAANNYSKGTVTPENINYQSPYDYKDTLKNATRKLITNSNSWSYFWIEKDDMSIANGHKKYCDNDHLGCYGPSGDKFNDPISDDQKKLVVNQLSNARNYAAGALAAASKSLPPLITDCTLSNAPCSAENSYVIDFDNGSEINFHLLENRKKNVKLFMTLDSSDGKPIITEEYGTGKKIELSDGTDLPWEGDYSEIWRGKLADGGYATNGEHTLFIRVEDEDGNSSEDGNSGEILQQKVTINIPSLSIEVTAPKFVRPGTSHELTVNIVNNTDYPFTNAEYNISTDGQLFSISGEENQKDIGTIQPGETKSFTYSVQANPSTYGYSTVEVIVNADLFETNRENRFLTAIHVSSDENNLRVLDEDEVNISISKDASFSSDDLKKITFWMYNLSENDLTFDIESDVTWLTEVETGINLNHEISCNPYPETYCFVLGSIDPDPVHPGIIELFLNENAYELPVGKYTAEVLFTNQTFEKTSIRKINLEVVDSSPVKKISVSPPFREVTSASGVTVFNVTNAGTDTVKWTTSENLDWFSVSPASGTNDGTVTVSYDANASADARTGTITFSVNG
ncbi:MAG: hypothetical protein D3920_12340, partial [Candidatus Electrothrix sp. AW2]|nr:hypothetical protein [Candidatus Electrothrix gigas]